MWALLGGGTEDDEGGIVLLGEELDGGGIIEWVDLVLLGELLGEWSAKGVEVGEGVLGLLGAGSAAEEKRLLWVLDWLWSLLVEGTLGARVSWFSSRRIRIVSLYPSRA